MVNGDALGLALRNRMPVVKSPGDFSMLAAQLWHFKFALSAGLSSASGVATTTAGCLHWSRCDCGKTALHSTGTSPSAHRPCFLPTAPSSSYAAPLSPRPPPHCQYLYLRLLTGCSHSLGDAQVSAAFASLTWSASGPFDAGGGRLTWLACGYVDDASPALVLPVT